jgi:hypothetical protein
VYLVNQTSDCDRGKVTLGPLRKNSIENSEAEEGEMTCWDDFEKRTFVRWA